MNILKNEKDKLLIPKINDKIKFCETRNQIQTSDFLSLEQQKQVENYLKNSKTNNYIFTGGFEEAERKIVLFYPDKYKEIVEKIDLNKYLNIIRINLPNNLYGEYSHKNYLGGVMKLGIEREKIGDIIVEESGADLIILPEILNFMMNNISGLTRFSKSKIEQVKLQDVRKIQIKTEIIKITVASMRLDNIISELARCSRTKAVEILQEERVFINHENFTKPSKEVKQEDIITIRGKGRFKIKNIIGNSRKGRIFLEVEKFI